MASRSGFEGFPMMNNESVVEGHRESPARCDDRAAGACQRGAGSGPFLNPGASVSAPVTSGLVRSDAGKVGRSAADDWRVAVHESGHILLHRIYGNEISATIVADEQCSGKVWWPQGVDAAVFGYCDPINNGKRDDDINGVFSIVQQSVIALMAGGAAEMTLLGDRPPKYIGSDVPNASHFAHMVCSTTASVVAFLEHGYQEALALVEQHQTVVAAIAQALIDHPERTLNCTEIDAVIVRALVAKAAADKIKRRADWNAVIGNAASFTAVLES
jgi:hypothetical protein